MHHRGCDVWTAEKMKTPGTTGNTWMKIRRDDYASLRLKHVDGREHDDARDNREHMKC